MSNDITERLRSMSKKFAVEFDPVSNKDLTDLLSAADEIEMLRKLIRNEDSLLRDQFAIAALQGKLSFAGHPPDGEIAKRAYSVASAMMVERDK